MLLPRPLFVAHPILIKLVGDIFVAQWAPEQVGGRQTSLAGDVLLVEISFDCLLAPCALLEVGLLLAFGDLVSVVS